MVWVTWSYYSKNNTEKTSLEAKRNSLAISSGFLGLCWGMADRARDFIRGQSWDGRRYAALGTFIFGIQIVRYWQGLMKYLVPDTESPDDHKGQQQSETKSVSHKKHKANFFFVKSRSVKRWIDHPCYLTSLHFKKRTISRITTKQLNESARQTLGKTGLQAVRKEIQNSWQQMKQSYILMYSGIKDGASHSSDVIAEVWIWCIP